MAQGMCKQRKHFFLEAISASKKAVPGSRELETTCTTSAVNSNKVIDITDKVINKEQNKQTIFYKGKQLMKAEAVIADHTNTIKLTLWEDLIDAVKCGKSYRLKNVKIRSFNDVKFLGTNEGTTIELQSDIQDISMHTEDINFNLNITEGKCLGVTLTREPSCIACNSSFKEQVSDGIIKCLNCHISLLQESCNTKLVGHLVIRLPNGKFQNYACFNDALQSFLASIGNKTDINTIDLGTLESLLLNTKSVQMIIDDATKTQFLL
ncbi:uncharacterized protein LOC116611476 [Nematostella vectensis]|uniref:uncharacterized protein LOC116611476 n=1 Tax=Nematostella vectensis TaxID=45351 RepID=UPI002076EDA7|nr:uncharacterized protein LOC116611476 [Nematostella vectensis]